MACGATSQKKVFWLVIGLVASARSQPVSVEEGAEVEGVLGADLQDLGIDNSQALSHINTLTNTLEHVFFRHGRELQAQAGDALGRQTAATLATSLGSLIRPAITAFVGALSMNSATSITNAITALLGGRSLDVIPAETFMRAPAGRDQSVLQPTRASADEVLKRRPARRKQRPAASVYHSVR